MSRLDPRRAKLHRSFSVGELADLLGVHPHTVRSWLKAGLPTVDSIRPTLILGSDFQAWWDKRAKAKKCPLKQGQFFCLKCREGRPPALGMVEFVGMNATTGNLKALCESCGTMMHRRTRMDRISTVMPGIEVQITEAPPSIGVRTNPSPNTDKPTED